MQKLKGRSEGLQIKKVEDEIAEEILFAEPESERSQEDRSSSFQDKSNLLQNLLFKSNNEPSTPSQRPPLQPFFPPTVV